MLTTRRFKKEYGSNICRHCVNDETGVHLYPKHCRYEAEYGVCPRCRRADKHIVSSFTLLGLIKLIGK